MTQQPPPPSGAPDAAPRLPTGAAVEVLVGAVAHGGHAVARLDGRVLFVRHALPGERVLARVSDGDPADGPTRRFVRADAVEVLAASPDRVQAPCAWARPGGCGGCDLQHVALPAQRAWKAAVLAEQLQRLAGITWTGAVEAVGEVAGAGPGLGWRTRVHLAVDGDGRAGLHPVRSHAVLGVGDCLLAHPAALAAQVLATPWPGADGVDVTVDDDGCRSVVAVPAAAATRGRRPAQAHQHAAGRDFVVSGPGFWQVHPDAAGALAAAVAAAAQASPGERALDLYAGVGLFAAGLAQAVGPSGRVDVVESSGLACADARANLADLRQAVVHRSRVDTFLSRWHPSADLVVLDPPRAGAGADVVAAVAATGATRVVYVACDPAALARDVATFAERGYRLAGLRAYDLFPMTHHLEVVAQLVSGRPG